MKSSQKLRGVNLGGWLVLEKWMMPEIFADTTAKDELSLSRTDVGPARIKKHHKAFIREADFKWLHEQRMNAVRIPVGYWIFGDEPPFVGGIEQLDDAFTWAKKYNLQILLCLHAAKGSQNGHDHSGDKSGKARWFKNSSYRNETVKTLERLVDRYHTHSALWGIELLNEPKASPKNWFILRRFYRRAFRKLSRKTRIIFSDAFLPRLMSGILGKGATLDVHWYQFILPFAGRIPLSWYYRLLVHRKNIIRRLQKKQPVMIGEWSIVLSHETLMHFPKSTHESMMDEHGRRQLEIYEQADGWFYWSYKTSGRGAWNFRSLVEDGRLKLDQAP